MRKTVILALLASFVVFACGKGANEAPVADAKQPWSEFVATVTDDYYRQNPELASDAGLHQYDGQMSDMSMAALGVFILFFGWFGFNAGSTTTADGTIARIAVNTFLAACAGSISAMLTVNSSLRRINSLVPSSGSINQN